MTAKSNAFLGFNLTMQERLRGFLEYKLATKLEFKQYLKDKSIPLEERWKLFTQYSFHLLDERDDCPALTWDNGEEISLLDDLYIERHESTWYSDFIEIILERIDYFKIASKDNPKGYSEPRLNELKEQILANGYYGFVYDW